jgi:hypothetical protein
MNANDGSFLAKHIDRLKGLYGRFGREGLRHCPPADVRLLLAAKKLEMAELPDRPSGRGVTEPELAVRHRMHLEVQDLTALARERDGEKTRTADKPRRRERGLER